MISILKCHHNILAQLLMFTSRKWAFAARSFICFVWRVVFRFLPTLFSFRDVRFLVYAHRYSCSHHSMLAGHIGMCNRIHITYLRCLKAMPFYCSSFYYFSVFFLYSLIITAYIYRMRWQCASNVRVNIPKMEIKRKRNRMSKTTTLATTKTK